MAGNGNVQGTFAWGLEGRICLELNSELMLPARTDTLKVSATMDQILLQNFIDVEKWDSARWKGTAFLHDPRGMEPPCLGIVFDNIDAGKQIFSGWIERLGTVDKYEELRISIVEGAILGVGDGYSVHISSDLEHAAQRAQLNASHPNLGTAIILGRVHRMTPELGSPHLPRFKKEFSRHKSYLFVPVSADSKPEFGLAIRKSEINFRRASEITAADLDAVVFPEHYFDHDTTIQ